jgi:hypothetical protein
LLLLGSFYYSAGSRKNFLFAGADSGGERAAAMYSVLETAKLQGLDPEAYLRHVLERIADQPNRRAVAVEYGRANGQTIMSVSDGVDTCVTRHRRIVAQTARLGGLTLK